MSVYKQQTEALVAPSSGGSQAEQDAYAAGFEACRSLAVQIAESADQRVAQDVGAWRQQTYITDVLGQIDRDVQLKARLQSDLSNVDQILLRGIASSDLSSADKGRLYQEIATLLGVSLQTITDRL